MPTTGILAIREAAKIPQCMPDLSTVQIFFVSQEALNTLQADFIKSRLVLQITGITHPCVDEPQKNFIQK